MNHEIAEDLKRQIEDRWSQLYVAYLNAGHPEPRSDHDAFVAGCRAATEWTGLRGRFNNSTTGEDEDPLIPLAQRLKAESELAETFTDFPPDQLAIAIEVGQLADGYLRRAVGNIENLEEKSKDDE